MKHYCPNDSNHFVKHVYISANLHFDFCDVCKDDIEFIASTRSIPIARGKFEHIDGRSYQIPLRNGSKHNQAHLVAGDSKSGKTFLTHSLIYEHQQDHPDSKVVILASDEKYDRLVQDFRGQIYDHKNNIYFNHIFMEGLSLIKSHPSTATQVESFVAGLINYATNKVQQKILFVIDIEKDLESAKNMDNLIESMIYSGMINFSFIFVNSDPQFKNFRNLSIKARIELSDEAFSSIFFCGQTKEKNIGIERKFKLDQAQSDNLSQAGKYRLADGYHQKTFFHFFKNELSQLFFHKVKQK
jgi:hypothetical protein